MYQSFKCSLLPAKTLFFAGLITFCTISCRTAEVAVDRDLGNGTETYVVKGKQGFQIGQFISFGNFKTGKVKRGWTFSYSVPFLVKFSGAKEKISFEQFDGNGNSAEVALVSRFKETEYQPIEDYFSVSLKYRNYFAGIIKLKDTEQPWDFIVHNVSGTSSGVSQNGTAGFVRSNHTKVDITGIRELKDSHSFLTQNDVYGYEFRLNGKVIGAVSTINNGKVWLQKDLSDDLKLILASVSSGLMLRNHIEDNALSIQ